MERQIVFILLYGWALAVLLFSYGIEYRSVERVGSKMMLRCRPWVAVAVFLPLIILAGQLMMVDKWAYMRGFLAAPTDIHLWGKYLAETSKDAGYAVFTLISRIFFGNNYILYFIFVAALQGAALIYVFRRYSCDFFISFFLFISSAEYIAWMCNGIRQFIAVCIIFAATPLMISRRHSPLAGIILLASTFHFSAVIMFPFVWIATGKAWNWKTLCYMAAALLAVALVTELTGLLDVLTADTQYEGYADTWTEEGHAGVNPLRAALFSIPAVISFFYRHEIEELDSPVVNLCVNMSVLAVGLWLVGMVTSGILIGRLPIYCTLYSFILLPWELHNLCSPKTKPVAFMVLVTVYSIFYYFSTHK